MNKWIRQVHRWFSIAFTVGVIANLIAVSQDAHANWIGMMADIPLILLMFTGLYLFALPYLNKRRGGSGTTHE